VSNVSGKAYAMTVITPVPPHRTWITILLFAAARLMPGTLKGLKGLSLIHFARWVIVQRRNWRGGADDTPFAIANDYMIFCSNFNGTWDQYVDAFADGIPNGLDLFWYTSTRYPNSVPISPFKGYIRANQIDNDYYYNATPGAAQRDIKAALRVRGALLALETEAAKDAPDAFAAVYRAALQTLQNDFGTQGYAPVASADTERADCNRNALSGGWPPPAAVSAGSANA
jgi:hypothetical protein